MDNASIIKNQESDDINIVSEQKKYINNEVNSQNKVINNKVIEENNSFFGIINKYKFWIISIFILVVLVYMAYKNYTVDTDLDDDILSDKTIDLFKKKPYDYTNSVNSLSMSFLE